MAMKLLVIQGKSSSGFVEAKKNKSSPSHDKTFPTSHTQLQLLGPLPKTQDRPTDGPEGAVPV